MSLLNVVKGINYVHIVEPCDFILCVDDDIWWYCSLEMIFYDGLDGFVCLKSLLRLIMF